MGNSRNVIYLCAQRTETPGAPFKPFFGLSGKLTLYERPEDWEWSSFRHYAMGAEGRVEIESEWTARKRERRDGKLCPAVDVTPGRKKQQNGIA